MRRSALRLAMLALIVAAPLAAQVAPRPVAARAIDATAGIADSTRRPPGRSLLAAHDRVHPRWEEETSHFIDRTLSTMVVSAPVLTVLAVAYMFKPANEPATGYVVSAATALGIGAALPRGHSECSFPVRMFAGTAGALAGAGLATLASGRRDPDPPPEAYWGAVVGAALAHPRCGGRY